MTHLPRILIVEDDRVLREILCEELSLALNCRILEAEGVRRGREILSSERIDLVITDLRMPDGSGIELLGWLRETFSGAAPPAIVMTGFARDDVHEMENQGAAAVIMKPFQWDRMIHVIRQVMPSIELTPAT